MINRHELYNTLTKLHQQNSKAIDQDLQWNQQPNHSILTPSHPDYPTLLQQIHKPPQILYIIGSTTILSHPQIAVVGSRNPTPSGREIATTMAADLVKAGFIITSGLAFGIDAASHQGALQAGGKTIAVLGNGLYSIYPRHHQRLAEQISRHGALVSEFPLSTPPYAKNFPRRNRIISGLSLGTLVVEAAPRSGSLITAHCAVQQNREVFAIPNSIRNPLAKGCHRLIQEGAKLVDSVEDIIAELATWVGGVTTVPSTATGKDPYLVLDADERKLIECIGFEPTSIDQLVARSGFLAAKVAAMLLDIELHGYISTVPGGVIRVR